MGDHHCCATGLQMRGLAVSAAVCLLATLLLADGSPIMQDMTLLGEAEKLGGADPTPAQIGESVREAELPLTLAKKVCQSTWLGTKKACAEMVSDAGRKPMQEMMDGIKVAGQKISEEALSKIPGNTTSVEMVALSAKIRREYSQLGESLDSMDLEGVDPKEAEKTLAHTACQIFWQSVESMCAHLDNSAEEDKSAVAAMARSQAAQIVGRAQSAAKIEITLPAPPPAPATNASYAEDRTAQEFQNQEEVQELGESDP